MKVNLRKVMIWALGVVALTACIVWYVHQTHQTPGLNCITYLKIIDAAKETWALE